MLITSYEYAEKIVNQNISLSWEGWNILEITPSQNAEFNKEGKIAGQQIKITFLKNMKKIRLWLLL